MNEAVQEKVARATLLALRRIEERLKRIEALLAADDVDEEPVARGLDGQELGQARNPGAPL
jgi:hypothetical protein